MKYFFLLLTLILSPTPALAEDAPGGAVLSRMLDDFLAGASVNDVAAHERFWADDLIYTSSRGLRFGKADILEGLEAEDDPGSQEPEVVYSAGDVRIQQYGTTAVVAFRLLGALQDGSGQVLEYFNTGTFVERDSEWRAVAWQATAIPAED